MSITLYGAALSPFVAKVLLQIRHKGLDIPMEGPPGGTGSDEYKKLNPTGKVPGLNVDGTVINESRAICDYIEETQGGASMRSSDPLVRAKQEALISVGDLYIGENLGALFGQLNPKDRNADIVASRLTGLKTGLSYLEAMLVGPYAAGDALTLADCAIAPYLFYVTRLMPMLGEENILGDLPKVAAYWEAIQANEAANSVFDDMAAAVAAMSA
jgi:glutathione S-transferase